MITPDIPNLSQEWKIKSILGEEVHVLNNLAQLIDRSERKEDILISVAEGCINAIEHGNQLEANKEVIIEFKEFITQYVIRIYDSGKGHLQSIYIPDIHLKVKELSPRGWGAYLIDTFTDEVKTGYADNGDFYIELIYHREIC